MRSHMLPSRMTTRLTLCIHQQRHSLITHAQLAIVNEPCRKNAIPKRFRSFHDMHALAPFLFGFDHAHKEFLASLNVSGSGQFSQTSCNTLVQWIKQVAAVNRGQRLEHLIMLDLRQEPHMFVHGHAVGMYTPADMFYEVDQHTWTVGCQGGIQRLIKDDDGRRSLVPFGPPAIDSAEIMHEAELCKQTCARHDVKCTYIHLPITDHHHPTPVITDRLVQLILHNDKLLPLLANPHSTTWLHTHCAGGAGRTTQTMLMIAMMALHHAGYIKSAHTANNRTAENNLLDSNAAWLLCSTAHAQHALGGCKLLRDRIPPDKVTSVAQYLRDAREPSAPMRSAVDVADVALVQQKVNSVQQQHQRREWSDEAACSAFLRSFRRVLNDGQVLLPAPTRMEAYAARERFLQLFASYVCAGCEGGWSAFLASRLQLE